MTNEKTGQEPVQRRRAIRLDKPNFFEADIAPTEGDIVFVGCRRELVVGDIPQNAEHGHLIRTAYRVEGQCIEQTYLVSSKERKCHTLTGLGSATGLQISELYGKRLREEGF